MITGDFNEGTKSLLELVKEADYRFLKSLNKKAIEPDSKIAYDIEREKGTHASLGRDLSSPGDFQKVRFGREWPREESYYHKGIPDWHPDEIRTEGVQKPPVSRENDFYPEIKVKNGRRGE